MKNSLGYGTGRRKSAIAKVWIAKGEGKITINSKDFQDYLGRPSLGLIVRSPLKKLEVDTTYDILAKVQGGGISGQAGAIKLGIARALIEMDPELRKELKSEKFLTRDSRVKERKKYGRKKARRGFQFTKR